MDLQLKDIVVIVTGGAKGIGAGIVRAGAGDGAIPVIIGQDASAGKQLQAEISKNGKCGLITMELSTPGHTTGQHLFVDGGYVHSRPGIDLGASASWFEMRTP